MADGGKSEEGMLKENKACSPVVRPASVLGVATLGDVSAEKKVRRIGKKIRQKRTMIRRGGRMSSGRCCLSLWKMRGLIGSRAATDIKWIK
jgi:hypothetical protein